MPVLTLQGGMQHRPGQSQHVCPNPPSPTAVNSSAETRYLLNSTPLLGTSRDRLVQYRGEHAHTDALAERGRKTVRA